MKIWGSLLVSRSTARQWQWLLIKIGTNRLDLLEKISLKTLGRSWRGYAEGKGELLLRPISLSQTLNKCLEELDMAISLPKNRNFALCAIFATSRFAALKICLFTVVAVLTHCFSAQRLRFLAAWSSSWTSRYRGWSLSARTRRRSKGACFSSKDWSVLLMSSIEGHSSGETSMHKSSRNAALSIAFILRDSLYTAGSGGTATRSLQTTQKWSEAIDWVTEVEHIIFWSEHNPIKSRTTLMRWLIYSLRKIEHVKTI